MYYVLTAKRKEEILATKDITECFDFVRRNRDTKVWTVDHNAKLKIYNKQVFLKRFLELTGNKPQLFRMAELMIKGKTNLWYFLDQLKLKREYYEYKELKKKLL